MRRAEPVLAAMMCLLVLHSMPGRADGVPAAGQVPGAELEPMTVSARGRGMDADLVPGSAEAVVANEAPPGTVGIAGIVSAVPGVSADSDGPWTSDVSIRGLSRDSVVMTIDGCRVNTATDIGARFSLLAPAAIESVEVLKGPISSLYGSGSLGGTVNVRTKSGHFSESPDRLFGLSAAWDGASAGIDGYAFGEYDGRNLHVYAGQTARSHGDYTDGAGDEVHNSGFRDRLTIARVGWRMVPGWTLEAGIQMAEANEVGIPGSGTAPLPAAADVTYERATRTLGLFSVTYEPEGSFVERSRLLFYGQEIERKVRIDAFPASSPQEEVRPEAAHTTRGFQWINTLTPGAGHTIAAGADAWEWSLTSSRSRLMRNGTTLVDDPLPDATYLSGGIFVEDDWTLGDRWIVNMGGRVDGIDVSNEANDLWDGRDTSETAWSLHAGTSVGLPGGLRAKCVVASGYRAATLSERYQYLELGGGVRKFGNPDLNPEQSLLTELGIVWTSQRGRAEIAAFRNVLDDMIGEKQEGTVTFRNENIARAEICGAEGRGIWLPASRVELGGQLAWATGRDADSGEFLPRIAPLTGAARAKAGTDSGWWAEAGIRFAAEQRETPDGTDNAPGWCIAEIRVGRDFSAGGTDHSAYVGVRNLADVEYRDYLATSRGTEYLEPGRSVIAGYEARF